MKINSLSRSLPNIEYVLIVLKIKTTPHQLNPNPRARSVIATAKNYCPQSELYAGHWRAGNNIQWYKWNGINILSSVVE